ncbi:MAG: hypothetical protein ACJ72E_15965 [Marmoricola sp.]
MKRVVQAGVVAAALVTPALAVPLAGATTAPVARAATSSGYRCQVDTLGRTVHGRIEFRRTVNAQVTVSRTSTRTFAWKPLSWGLVSSNTYPGHESVEWTVPSSDGKVRLVRTSWSAGNGALGVTVERTIGSGFPHTLVASEGRQLFWIAADGDVHHQAWNGRHWSAAGTFAVSLPGARAITASDTPDGIGVYVTDGAGALHVLNRGQHHVLAQHGFSAVTGMKAGVCMSPDYAYERDSMGLITVNRRTGAARFSRHLHPDSAAGGSITGSVAVRQGGWTWAWLG